MPHFIEIVEGEIALRDDRKKSTWTEKVQSFDLSSTPVTQELYEFVVGSNPSAFRGPELPVESVSWLEAIQFCNLYSAQQGLNCCYTISDESEETTFDRQANGYRLPTDAEWEYACRAGAKKFTEEDVAEVAWYKENSDSHTHPVGQRTPNSWGLFDMLGNVWEWCWDLYDPDVYGAYRIFRGGGWNDESRGCLPSNRRRSHPTYKIDDLGFRIAKNHKANLNAKTKNLKA